MDSEYVDVRRRGMIVRMAAGGFVDIQLVLVGSK
jgi:hypothetical protein